MSSLKVAFEGIPGAHSTLVIKAYCESIGVEHEPVGLSSGRQVAQAILGDVADIGILPIDNALAGTIRDGYELLVEYNLEPFAEIVWRMDNRLLGLAQTDLSQVKQVLAHPIVLNECGKFISALHGARGIPCEDTGVAAKEVAADRDASKVCIGPPEAGTIYGLVELAANIADHPDNVTRFLLFRSPKHTGLAARLGGSVPPKDRKTSLLLSISHERGQLATCLNILNDAGINLLKLESRPKLGRPFEVLFYLDIEGDRNQPHVAEALDKLRASALNLNIVGSYDTYPLANVSKVGAFSLTPRLVLADQDQELEGLMPSSAKNYPRAVRTSQPGRTIISIGDVDLGGDDFIVMAGPCSVESKDQVMATAVAVKGLGARLLRGGAFKPRTNPYAFQGLGWDGVKMLAEAGRATGLPIVTEVMSVDQVDQMAREADVLQIGARNMQNYDLLKKVGLTSRPILLKRGLSASLDELLSAAEYILAAGNPKVILCERGIRTFETSTRFTLDLSAVTVLRERSHLPIVIDPSHGVGVRRWIKPMCLAAKAAGAHGIIVEVHPNPEEAKSDKDQALTFEDFASIMNGLEKIPNFSSL